MKKKPAQPPPPSPVQNQSFQISEGQRAAGNQTLDTAKQGFSPYLAGSDGMSEFRRALTGNLSHATALTGNNAIAHSRERAAAAGFGGQQPITFGAENQLANEQAGRIAAIPGQVEAQAAPLELQAAGQTANIGQTQLGSANPYYNAGIDLERQRQEEFARQQEEARKRKAGIWGSLARIGLTAASAIPGAGPIVGSLGGAI